MQHTNATDRLLSDCAVFFQSRHKYLGRRTLLAEVTMLNPHRVAAHLKRLELRIKPNWAMRNRSFLGLLTHYYLKSTERILNQVFIYPFDPDKCQQFSSFSFPFLQIPHYQWSASFPISLFLCTINAIADELSRTQLNNRK